MNPKSKEIEGNFFETINNPSNGHNALRQARLVVDGQICLRPEGSVGTAGEEEEGEWETRPPVLESRRRFFKVTAEFSHR